jgi:hypothetical protein
MRGFRHAFVHLALAALIVRAFLPTGWMPNPQGPAESMFVICTMDGPVQATDGKTLPGKDDPRAHETCPFAAAASLAPPMDFIRLAAPELSRSPAPRILVAALSARAPPFTQPASRAPPTLT